MIERFQEFWVCEVWERVIVHRNLVVWWVLVWLARFVVFVARLSSVRVKMCQLKATHDGLLERASAIAQLCKHGHVWNSRKGAEASVVNASLVNIVNHDRVVDVLIRVFKGRLGVLWARRLISKVELLEGRAGLERRVESKSLSG